MEYVLIENDVRVTLHDETGEGWNGDYDSSDPDDQLLFRFDVDYFHNGDWVAVDNASYCTSIPSDIDSSKANRMLHIIMKEVADSVRNGNSVKRCCEKLTWIRTKDLE